MKARASNQRLGRAEDSKIERRSVLHITNCEGGGVPRAILAQIRNAPEMKHTVLWPQSNDELVLSTDLTTIPLLGGMLRRWLVARSVMKSLGVDVVIAHSSVAGVWLRTSRQNIPSAYQPHTFAFENMSRNRLFQKITRHIERLLASRSTILIALTPYESRVARSLGAPRVLTVRNAVEKVSATQMCPDSAMVVTSGRIVDAKDPQFFAEVAKLVHGLFPKATFLWIGDGDESSRAELEAAGVRVTGWLTPDQVVNEMQRSGLYLHTAAYEGFPLAILEAAMIGLPIVARMIPAYEGSQVRGDTTPEGVAEMVAECLRGGDLRQELQQASVAISSASTPEQQSEDLRVMYQYLLRS